MWNSPDIEYKGTGVRTKCRASALFFVEEPRRAKLQQEFVDLRFGMFNHFNLATFQDREWGDPHDPPTVFDPTAVDTDQWASAAKSAGMTWGCLTPKHHDGFCLWLTATPVASVTHTKGQVDVVRSYAAV